jgi:hypothetical protein
MRIFISLVSFMETPDSMRILHKTSLLTEQWAFFKFVIVDSLFHCIIIFFKCLENVEYMVSSWPAALKSWAPIISSADGVNIDSKILDKFCLQLTKVICPVITKFCFITLLINRYNDRTLPILRQFPLISTIINKCNDLRTNCSTYCFNQFCWNPINTRWFVPF